MIKTKTKVGKYRYRILLMIIYATTIHTFDKSLIGVMAPVLEKIFGWSNNDYANIMISYKLAYLAGMLIMGGLIDKFDSKKGYILTIGISSVFGMLHAAIRPAFGVIGFILARVGLGFGQAGNFPVAQKTIAEWFPKKERAFATSIYFILTGFGAVLAPFVVGWIVNDNGKNWQIPFLITGVLSTIWVLLWYSTYNKPEKHAKLTRLELEHIKSDDDIQKSENKISWIKLLNKRQTWIYPIAKIADAVWFFYLFWLAKYLSFTFGLDIKHIGIPYLIIFLLADVGIVFGGWISGSFINKGWTVNKARKLTLLACALIILPVCLVTITQNMWIALILIGLGAAGHGGWNVNAVTLVSDLFPAKKVASVTGIGGAIGIMAAMIFDKGLGKLLDTSEVNGYFIAFLIAGSLYLLLLGLIHLIVPKMTPLDENLDLING